MITTERKIWIDILRGICMVCILLLHTEIYYTGSCIINYNLYVTNALTIFFFISGYLFYKEKEFSLKRKLVSIMRSLLLPYLIFTSFIALPKAIAHQNATDLISLFLPVLEGKASWFVAALCLSELIFSITLWISKDRKWIIVIVGIIGLALSDWLSMTGIRPYIWQLDNSMQALFFLSLGYFYHIYEQHFQRLSQPLYLLILFILLITIKVYEQNNNICMLIWYIGINNYTIFIIDTTICTLFMIHLCKILPTNRLIEYTGSHSIVYYFLCGGIPLLTGKIMNMTHLEYNGNYLYVIFAFIIVYFLDTIATWTIYRYIPFITGQKRNETNYR